MSPGNRSYNLIILAGGERGPLSKFNHEKALIEIHGKSMLDHVVNAFHETRRMENIIVVGSHNLDDLPCMEHVRRRMFTGANLVQNLLHAITYVKHRIYRSAHDHNGYLISFCDAAFLTPEIITDTIDRIDAADADIALHYVEQASFEDAGLNAKRTYIPIGGKKYTGSTIYYVRKFSRVLPFVKKLHELRKTRKDPAGILKLLGCEDEDLAGVERVLSEELGLKVALLVSPHPELGMDVDKPADLELANSWLDPEKNAPDA